MASTGLPGAYVKNTPGYLSEENTTVTEYLTPTNFSLQEDDKTKYFDAACFSTQENTVIQHVEPAGEQAMIEHFELAQGSRGNLPEAEFDCHGRVIELQRAQLAEWPIDADFTPFDRSEGPSVGALERSLPCSSSF